MLYSILKKSLFQPKIPLKMLTSRRNMQPNTHDGVMKGKIYNKRLEKNHAGSETAFGSGTILKVGSENNHSGSTALVLF
jgi:hypothetical protein